MQKWVPIEVQDIVKQFPDTEIKSRTSAILSLVAQGKLPKINVRTLDAAFRFSGGTYTSECIVKGLKIAEILVKNNRTQLFKVVQKYFEIGFDRFNFEDGRGGFEDGGNYPLIRMVELLQDKKGFDVYLNYFTKKMINKCWYYATTFSVDLDSSYATKDDLIEDHYYHILPYLRKLADLGQREVYYKIVTSLMNSFNNIGWNHADFCRDAIKTTIQILGTRKKEKELIRHLVLSYGYGKGHKHSHYSYDYIWSATQLHNIGLFTKKEVGDYYLYHSYRGKLYAADVASFVLENGYQKEAKKIYNDAVYAILEECRFFYKRSCGGNNWYYDSYDTNDYTVYPDTMKPIIEEWKRVKDIPLIASILKEKGINWVVSFYNSHGEYASSLKFLKMFSGMENEIRKHQALL